ncbi:MAG TPA: tripartite tricarboxylate transporter TctB family protein [Stellaceae bacterium]|jgi:hypothetical protein|nr:tripartite tricarboxylate transporter TctB family protein [Stellaceae bacterium]
MQPGEGKLIGAAWAGRAFAGLCAIAGVYAASVSLAHTLHGEAASAWLLPLAAGALTTLLSLWVAIGGSEATIGWRALGHRVGAMALLAAYALLLLPFFGFLTASILLILAIAMFYASNRLFVGAGGLIIAVGMWALFSYVLAEPLPGGLLWR